MNLETPECHGTLGIVLRLDRSDLRGGVMAAKNPTDVGNDGPIAELPEQTWDEVMVKGNADKFM